MKAVSLVATSVLGALPAGAIPPPPDSFDGETIHCHPAGSATTVGLRTLQQLQWLLWLLLALQLSTILLLLSGPVPAPRRPQAGAPLATTGAAGATVLSPSQL
jgi:hypothetical protein